MAQIKTAIPAIKPPAIEMLRDCQAMSRTLRRWIIEQSLASNVGHIGSALSIVDLMSALWGAVMQNPGTGAPDRDRFILSKGHAALALYAALRWKGLIDEKTYQSYCVDGTRLGVHPECGLEGVDLCTGSLGHGLSVGCGLAIGFRRRDLPSHVYVLLSDAECNEGQVWEAAMFAAQHRLSNLTAIVDLNGLQALGSAKSILNLNQPAIWSAFGWAIEQVDGHDLPALIRALDPPDAQSSVRPRAVIARTIAGYGVAFMENRVEWHYRNLTPEQARAALQELEHRQ